MRPLLVVLTLMFLWGPAPAGEPLSSWNPGPVRQALLSFVIEVSTPGPDFVPPEQRIAVFDNDGTLWPEQPQYFRLAFARYRLQKMLPEHPEWRGQPLVEAALKGDVEGLARSGSVGPLVTLEHAGMDTESYRQAVLEWAREARHPRFQQPYTRLAYQPMVELLGCLREHGFKVYVVTGGGADFIRPWSEPVYGIPPEQVVGSSAATRFEMRQGVPVLVRSAQLESVYDGQDKPVGIDRFIGRRPILAFGNSDKDIPMLQWTAAGSGPHLCLLLHHTDGQREYAYDRESPMGALDRGLDEALGAGWIVVDMQKDWKRVFSFEEAP